MLQGGPCLIPLAPWRKQPPSTARRLADSGQSGCAGEGPSLGAGKVGGHEESWRGGGTLKDQLLMLHTLVPRGHTRRLPSASQVEGPCPPLLLPCAPSARSEEQTVFLSHLEPCSVTCSLGPKSLHQPLELPAPVTAPPHALPGCKCGGGFEVLEPAGAPLSLFRQAGLAVTIPVCPSGTTDPSFLALRTPIGWSAICVSVFSLAP